MLTQSLDFLRSKLEKMESTFSWENTEDVKTLFLLPITGQQKLHPKLLDRLLR